MEKKENIFIYYAIKLDYITKVNRIPKRNIIDIYTFINQKYSYGNILKKIRIQKVKNTMQKKNWKNK